MTETSATTTVTTSPGAANTVAGKSLWRSKTLWTAVITAILPFIPVVNVWAGANPQLVGVALGVIFGALRLATKDKLVIK